jgi:hypothetical protein
MPDHGYTRRERGSARFAPFYTLQRYDDVSMCWRDVDRHRRYGTADAAWSARPSAGRIRIAETSPDGCVIIERIAPEQAAG